MLMRFMMQQLTDTTWQLSDESDVRRSSEWLTYVVAPRKRIHLVERRRAWMGKNILNEYLVAFWRNQVDGFARVSHCFGTESWLHNIRMFQTGHWPRCEPMRWNHELGQGILVCKVWSGGFRAVTTVVLDFVLLLGEATDVTI